MKNKHLFMICKYRYSEDFRTSGGEWEENLPIAGPKLSGGGWFMPGFTGRLEAGNEHKVWFNTTEGILLQLLNASLSSTSPILMSSIIIMTFPSRNVLLQVMQLKFTLEEEVQREVYLGH